MRHEFMAISDTAAKQAWTWITGWVWLAVVPAAFAAQPAKSDVVTGYASETRNRANVLLVGEAFTAGVAERLQKQWQDEINVYRPAVDVADAGAALTRLGLWLEARPWHVVVLALSPGETNAAAYAAGLREIANTLKERKIVLVWSSAPAAKARANVAVFNDAARQVMRAEGAEFADLHGAMRGRASELRDERWGWTEYGADVVAETVSRSLKRALLSRSTPWAELPIGDKHDPARLLADPQALKSPMDLPEVKGRTATIFRAEHGAWQFNLHSFVAHHDGKFWAVWSSGRVDEDSSSQFIRYATSTDGFAWSESAVLASDPDGESGLWRWMASGIYVDNGRLYALGSLNQGNNPPGGPWANARLVRFVWTGSAWKEDIIVAENCVVYFPPLRIEGRDFFVWRDSRAHFFTGYAPVGTTQWEVTRVPGPLPDYRMSETAAYVDPDGVVHLIIRDQGYTRRLYHSVSYDAGATWTIPAKTNYPDAASKNMAGRLTNGWYYLINNPKESGTNARDPLAISFSRDGWTFSNPMALRKNAPPLRYKGGAKGPHSFQYSHAIEHDGKLWVIYATNKEDIEISAFPIDAFGLNR